MKKLILFTVLSGLFLAGCTPAPETGNMVTVSIIPQKYFIDQLTSGGFDVNVMVPAGASPASYEPTPRQMKDLEASGLYFAIGHLGFEKAWLPRIKKNQPDLKVIDTSVGIDLITDEHQEGEVHDHDGHHHHGTDPHIWMSPRQVSTMINHMAGALIRHDQACQDLITSNRDSLLNRLEELDSLFKQEMGKLSNRKFIIFHPALTYLARDYGLEQISMEFEGKEPAPAHMKRIVDRAKAEDIRVIFIQKEFDQENATQLSKEIDGQLIQIDPLAENWMDQMYFVLDKLKKLDAHPSE